MLSSKSRIDNLLLLYFISIGGVTVNLLHKNNPFLFSFQFKLGNVCHAGKEKVTK